MQNMEFLLARRVDLHRSVKNLSFGFALILLSLLMTQAMAAAPETIQFNRDIRPILSDKCFACHGFDASKRQANLRLDTLDGAVAQHDGKKAIEPGDLSRSEAWQRIISRDESVVMPPPDSHKTLNDEERSLIRRWIEQGAVYQKHWSFESIQRHDPPVVANSLDCNPVDAFLIKRLEQDGRSMQPEADKNLLIRRVAFALTGLPPKLEEQRAYLEDSTPDAYERMVDRYLDSQHFGEEMARHWLDVARYADTHGMHLDNERQTWAYRDWVIGAFNRNLSFDQFTIEQLAGDLLPNPTTEQIVATGFNRCNVTTSEGGSIGEELLYRYAVDRASTTMQTWLGLTGGCAVCHDHKFDPITQKDFYSFYAFFNSAADPAMDGNALLTQPILKLDAPDLRAQIDKLDVEIAALQKKIDEQFAAVEYLDPADVPESERPQTALVESIWLDDEFPAGGKTQASPGKPTQFVKSSDAVKVFSGQRALKRTDKGLAQDVWDDAKVPLVLPAEGKIFAYVWLDPINPPRSIMLQFFKKGWEHRAVWGDYNAIDWGAVNTTERVDMGQLPEVGQWLRLEVPIEKVGLSAGDKLKGFALTQFGGTVMWDKVGVIGTGDPTKDPQQSFRAWWKSLDKKSINELPAELRGVAKDGPDKESKPEQLKKLRTHYLQEVHNQTRAQFSSILAERKELDEKRKKLEDTIPGTFVFKDLPKPRDSFVMMRGAYDKPGQAVEPNVPEVLPPLKKGAEAARSTRLDLARWLVAPENPLVARVTVNRFWQQFFGIGLVKTSYDFGSQGDMPSHPELLDWLANDFRESGWNVKRMVRMLVTSKAFRQSSRITPDLMKYDPENRLYARGPRFRLDAEQIRDNALMVSGLIQLDMGGKGVRPYQPENIWEPVGFGGSNTRFYKRDSGPALYRRSIYTFFKRTAPPPFMINFDAPNREQFCTRREKSNTPLQALQLMNDVQHVEAARELATKIMQGCSGTPRDRITLAYEIVLARKPDERELLILEKQLKTNIEHYASDVDLAKKLVQVGESKPNEKLDAVELASYTLIANTLLNLDETLTRN